MLRSLRARVLVATIGVACAAVAATAWLTYSGTTNRLEAGARQQAQVDAYIYDELRDHARTHPTWRGVDDRLRELRADTGRRIALTSLSGRLLADTAGLDGGEGPPLPERPAAVIDALDASSSQEEAAEESRRPPYRLTPAELARQRAIAEDVSDCLTAAGIGHVPLRGEDGVPEMFVRASDERSADYRRCVDGSGLDTPSAAEVEVRNEESRLVEECLEREGVPFTASPAPAGGVIALEVRLSDGATSDVFRRCTEAAFRTANDPLIADPVRLYLGERDESEAALRNAGPRRAALAAGLVAVLAVGLSVLASRRVLRPVAALTTAAQRMEQGDLAQRVEVDDPGRDEIAGLAHAFNAMADALDRQEELRRRLVNDVAHELRTPLANIRGYLEVAIDGITPADEALLESVHEEALLLQQLVDDLQTLSLLEAGRLALHPETVDLAEVVDQVVAARRPRAAAGGVVLTADVDAPVAVHADPLRLRQALGNLVDNALRHTPRDRQVDVVVWTDGDDAVIDVVDTGEGIAPEHLAHLFDRFWRADTARARDTGGSGLGLAICRELIDQQRGSVAVASALGKGSTFRIRLPLAPNPDVPGEHDTASGSDPAPPAR
jgi:two-component system, OmpR family, sensor histidine kinase BaeS